MILVEAGVDEVVVVIDIHLVGLRNSGKVMLVSENRLVGMIIIVRVVVVAEEEGEVVVEVVSVVVAQGAVVVTVFVEDGVAVDEVDSVLIVAVVDSIIVLNQNKIRKFHLMIKTKIVFGIIS